MKTALEFIFYAYQNKTYRGKKINIFQKKINTLLRYFEGLRRKNIHNGVKQQQDNEPYKAIR
jgi:hypothetical protein